MKKNQKNEKVAKAGNNWSLKTVEYQKEYEGKLKKQVEEVLMGLFEGGKRVFVMAGKASKKQAQGNLDVLNKLYKVTVPVILLALIRTLLSKNNNTWFKFIVLHIPIIACIYVLDKSGRPSYEYDGKSKKIVKEGLDLSQEGGLTSYMFDLIYLSLFGDIGRILFDTNKFWFVLVIVVPIYVVYKLYGLKQQFMPGGVPKYNTKKETIDEESSKSKRQMKKEKRGDKAQVKYR